MALLRAPAALSSRLSDERGVTLVETLISAVILAIVVGAVLTTIDASGRTAAVNKNRSVAATLAEQDQERMRAMTPTALAGHTLAQDIRPDGPTGPTYHVDSKADWVFDASGATESCNNDSGQANYLRITSTVTSKVVGTRVAPVVMRSIVSPRVGSFADNTGTLTVMVKDQLDRPVPNMPVSISPAASAPKDTNEFGCAVFSHIPTGAYTATLDRIGWINELRQQRFDKSTTVTRNQTTSVSMTYAPAATIQVRFTTRPSGSATPVASNADALTVSNTKSGDITVQAPAATTPVGTLTVTSLFPYSDGYTAYTGRCGLNDPTAPEYPSNANYFTSMGFPGFTNVTPPAPAIIDVHQPSVNLRIVDSTASGMSGARVVFTAATTGCGRSATVATFVRQTDANGYLVDRGLPFGTYTGCVDRAITSGGITQTYRKNLGTITNTNPAGTAVGTQFSLTTSDTRASCAT
jgi:Tfp pilus assembly protein PilV